MAIRRTFSAGTRIFDEGAAGDCAYVIEDGVVDITIARGGRDVLVARRCASEIFGEMSIVDEAPRSASATAASDCRLLILPVDQLQNRLQRLDPVLSMVFGVILERFRDSMKTMRGEPIGAPAPADADRQDAGDETGPPRAFCSAIDRIKLEQELREAIAEGRVEFHYQPIVCAHARRVTGYEALARWRCPTRGMVAPQHFIPIAEETGLIRDISRNVVGAACATAARLRAQGVGEHTYVSVNVTPEDICDPSFLTHVAESLRAAALPPDGLILEITESTVIDNAEDALAMMARYQDLGVRISIDDFGAGYSNFGYLARYPVQWLKIDKAVVDQIAPSENAASDVESRGEKLARAIVSLARSLDLKVVAEGVETAAQADALSQLGCDLLQGYHFGRPAPLM